MSHPPLDDHAPALAHLQRDPQLGVVLQAVGPLPVLQPTPQPFQTLVRSVVGQQLSTKAARGIYQRLCERCPELMPAQLLSLDGETLRQAGLSWAKVRTVQALAQAVVSGSLELDGLQHQPDQAVIASLLPLPGIGRWTAEMFLIFGLARPDVFSLGDLGLRRGLERLYPTSEPAAVLVRWQPYRSLAARYLWAMQDGINRLVTPG